MNRLERVREEVDRILTCLLCDEDRRCGFAHLYGVSHAATELAYARGLDVELAAVAGMLHDLTNYTEGESSDHGLKSARLAERMLERLALFSPDEVATITHAIARHSDKDAINEPMDELLKDADALQHWLYDPSLPPQSSHAERRGKIETELTQRSRPCPTAESEVL